MTHTSIGEGAFSELLSRLPASLDLAASARESGALLRRRGVKDAPSLLRLALGYAAGGLSLRGTAAWAEVGAIARLSDVALLNRLRGAAGWLGRIVVALLSARTTASTAAAAGRAVRLVDATTLSCPGSRKTDWRVHVGYRLDGGGAHRIDHIELSDGRGAESLRRFACSPGDVLVGDRGYAKAQDLAAVCAAGADFIVRTGWNAVRLCTPEGERLDLAAIFDGLAEGSVAAVQAAIALDRRKCPRLLPVRLIVLRKSEADAERSRRRARHRSRRQGKTAKAETLRAAGYVLLLTSLDAASVSAAAVLALYRLRWQIELLFKRLKSLLHLDDLPAKDPDLARSWLYAKLITALLLEDATRPFVDSPPCADGNNATQRFGLAHPAPAV